MASVEGSSHGEAAAQVDDPECPDGAQCISTDYDLHVTGCAEGSNFTYDAWLDECVCWANCGDPDDNGSGDPPDDDPGDGSGGTGGGPPPGVDPADWDPLNEAERALCLSQLSRCPLALQIGYGALQQAMAEGSTSAEQNALRHAYWQARLTAVFDIGYANNWAIAHESDSTDPVDTQIDWHNNQQGQQIGLLVLNGVYGSIGAGVGDYLDTGQLWCGVNIPC